MSRKTSLEPIRMPCNEVPWSGGIDRQDALTQLAVAVSRAAVSGNAFSCSVDPGRAEGAPRRACAPDSFYEWVERAIRCENKIDWSTNTHEELACDTEWRAWLEDLWTELPSWVERAARARVLWSDVSPEREEWARERALGDSMRRERES